VLWGSGLLQSRLDHVKALVSVVVTFFKSSGDDWLNAVGKAA
jgi:hypothetical protein